MGVSMFVVELFEPQNYENIRQKYRLIFSPIIADGKM